MSGTNKKEELNTEGENVNIILDVPFVSQNSDHVPLKWHDSACGIAAVKMLIDFFGNNGTALFKKTPPTMTDLIAEGEAINGFTKHGWMHEALVRLLRNHGVMAYPQEYRAVNVTIDDVDGTTFSDGLNSDALNKNGVAKIIRKIKSDKPVIVSVNSGFGNNKHTHIVVITGYTKTDDTESFYYHDPDSRQGSVRENHPVSISDFLKHWRQFVIFAD